MLLCRSSCLRVGVVVVVALLAVLGRAAAKEIDVPIRFDHELIRQTVLAQIYTSTASKAKLWDDGTGCGFLTLWDPRVDSVDGRLRILTQGEAQVGTPFGDACLAPVQWKGFIEVWEAPVLSDDRQTLLFRVVGSNLLDAKRSKGFFTARFWDLVKEHVQPRFEAIRFDLHTAMQDLREILPLMVGAGDTPRIEAMLSSLRLQQATITSTGVTVDVRFTVNPGTLTATPSAEPTLTTQEIEHWQTAWQRWDGFLTFVVKILGQDIPAKDVQIELRDILLDARFDILQALAPQPGVADPTRPLFLKTWERLAPVVRASSASLPGSTGLRYLSFITAGEALAALDQAGPEIGLDISADGLRRLARMLAPSTIDDPLAYGVDVDPQLRTLFGFGEPLPAPDLSDMPTEEPEGVTFDDPANIPLDIPAEPSGQATPEPRTWLPRLWQPATAHAAPQPNQQPPAVALERWIVERDNVDVYLQAVREILRETTAKTLQGGDLPPKYHEVYRRLVLTTAWKESCWRQFVRSKGKVTYLKSSVGAAGMMQVYEKVWRGIYDVQGLRWDINYNARAGADILLHYISDYAIAKKEDQHPGGIDNLARATYAVYNGGPGHRTRYRNKDTKRSLRMIDESFYEKYRAVSAARELDVAQCLVGK